MSNMFQRKVFLVDFGKEYSELTHLHGFKEMSLSSSKVEKLSWFFIILGSFGFTGSLIFKSIQDSLDDDRTFIDYKKYGNISLPVLYCPTEWIDLKKMNDANISENYVIYALSYLRMSDISYMIENVFLNQYHIDEVKDLFCDENRNEEKIIPSLVFFAPYIETKCLDYDRIPNYYGKYSRNLIKFKKLTQALDMSNTTQMKAVFDACQSNKYEMVWKFMYYDFFLSPSMEGFEENIGTFGLNLTMTKCVINQNAVMLTLHDLDNWNNESQRSCYSFTDSKLNDKHDFYNDINLCSMYNDAIIFYMFHGEKIRDYFDTTRSSAYANFQERHTNKILQIISTQKKYQSYLQRHDWQSSSETFKKYMNNEIGGSFLSQNDELSAIRNWAEEEFKKSEKKEFYEFLTERNFTTVLDIFKLISIDENKFLLGLSVDRLEEIRPRDGTVSVKKIINAFGVCYLFEINADMNPVTNLSISFNSIDRRRKLNEKLYVNIIELDTQNSKDNKAFVRSGDNIITVGSDARSLIPSENSFIIERNYDKSVKHFYAIKISNLDYQLNIAGNCQSSPKALSNNAYLYSNCLIECNNKHSQQKSVDGFLMHKAKCQYVAESMEEIDKDEQCSFFTETLNVSSSIDGDLLQSGLVACNDRCIEDCSMLKFDVETMQTECDLSHPRQSQNCRNTQQSLDVEKYSNDKSLLFNYYLNLPSNGLVSSPVWMKPCDVDEYGGPTIYDMIKGITHVYASPIARMEIQINSDVTVTLSRPSLEWYNYLGVVGGQINLIISGSLLTIFQLFWWCLRYFYNHCRMPRPTVIREEELSVMLCHMDKENVKCLKYKNNGICL